LWLGCQATYFILVYHPSDSNVSNTTCSKSSSPHVVSPLLFIMLSYIKLLSLR